MVVGIRRESGGLVGSALKVLSMCRSVGTVKKRGSADLRWVELSSRLLEELLLVLCG